MRFLVDECTGPAVARWLRDQSHAVFSVYEEARGRWRELVMAKAIEYLRGARVDFDESFDWYAERGGHYGKNTAGQGR